MSLKYGKKPARPEAIKFRFADFFAVDKLPTPPATFGHYQNIPNFFMLGNEEYGDCVWAGAAHETMIWTLEGKGTCAPFTVNDVLSDYTAVTGFDPNNPNTDQGTDMVQAAQYRQKTGIRDANGNRHKIDAYISLKTADLNELMLAMWLFGAVGIGINVPSTMQDQFMADQPLTVPDNIQIEGGHYISGVGRDSDSNILIVTWGQIARMTPEFYQKFNDETVAYLSLESLNSKNLSPEGYDAAGLQKALAQLNG